MKGKVRVGIIAHKFHDHGVGSTRVMTGRIPDTPTGTLNDSPSVISIVNKMRDNVDVGLPNCVTIANGRRSTVDTHAQGAAYLGMKYQLLPGRRRSEFTEVRGQKYVPWQDRRRTPR